MRSRRVRFGAAFVLLLALVLALHASVRAISEENDKVLFGPIGVALNEGVRINMHAIGDPDSIGDPGIQAWTFTVRVFNRRGTVALERRVDVLPGTFATVGLGLLDPAQFPSDTLGRRTLRAEIVGFNPQPDPPGGFTTTLEVIGLLDGRTHIFLGGPDTVPIAVAR